MALKVRSYPVFYSPTGFQKLTVSGTAISFTVPTTIVTRAVVFSVETDQIRFRVDGSDPDSTTGVILSPGDVVEITNVDMINNFTAIRVNTDAILQIHYFGGGV